MSGPTATGNSSNLCDSLDTFHAEFITQPITDYPMLTPPPPIQEPPTTICTTLVSPNYHPPMSPSLPTFLETYQNPTMDMDEQQVNNHYSFKKVRFVSFHKIL